MENVYSNLHHCIDELMILPSVSMFVKSFTLVAYIIVHNRTLRQYLKSHHRLMPWRNLDENDEWNYKNVYSNHHEEHMTEEEKKRQWYAYLDFWFEDCMKI